MNRGWGAGCPRCKWRWSEYSYVNLLILLRVFSTHTKQYIFTTEKDYKIMKVFMLYPMLFKGDV